MRRKTEAEVPRPLCMCGEPGAFKVEIHVQELVLDRESGMASRPFWTAKYRSGTSVDAIMCRGCVKANVQLQVAASAVVEKAKGR